MDLKQHCGTQERRQKVLASNKLLNGLEINGIDYLEVLDADAPAPALRQKLIDLTFLKADGVTDINGDPLLGADNFVIEGGVRILGVSVLSVAARPDKVTLRLALDKAGDFSPYRLILIDGVDADPPPNFDPVLSSLVFSFKADCPTDFDCLPLPPAGQGAAPGPAIDYLAKDYESFRRLMLDRMAVTIPAWTERSPADLGVALVETLAYGADMASYYQDAVATEAYLSRARLRTSARRHARMLGYAVDEGCNTRVFVALNPAQDADQASPPLIPRGSILLTRPAADQGFGALPAGLKPDPEKIGQMIRSGCRVFETMEDVARLRTARHEMRFHTWSGSNCCLPPGTTEAYLVGGLAATGLAPGDVLILEERIPLGGTQDDPPDPAHRQAVRLTQVKGLVDRLDDTPVLEIRWALADALRFPLNLQGDGPEPGAVVHGNVVLADHGRTLDYVAANPPGPLTPVQEATIDASIHADLKNRHALTPRGPVGARPYRPTLIDAPVTRAQPYDPLAMRARPAVDALAQSSAAALPAIVLEGGGETWAARADLLLSDRLAAEFVVETANDQTATLRFGDGRFGKSPGEGDYRARLRVGNGSAGLVGADAIGHLVTDDTGLLLGLTNPLPSVGGADPESLTAIKLYAPRAFKTQKRAVTAQDYAAFAQTHPDVDRAVAERRWTGSWHTMFIAIDRRGGREVDPKFEAELLDHLEPYRLAGHDIEIEPPAYVPLDVALVVCVAPGHYAEHVEQALLDRFSAQLTADGVPGFFHPDHFTFGQPVLLSRIVAAAMAVDGVSWVGMQIDGFRETGRFRRLDDQSVDYADDGLLPIGRREVARLDNDPNAPERGRLRFIMEGGR
jgi:hypothetical protein